MKTLVELSNVFVMSLDYPILNDISVKIPAQKSTVIMGPSGCGKSTLLKVLAGIIIPDSGKLLFEGENIFSISDKKLLNFKKRNGFVFQDSALWSNKSIFNNLALPLQFHYSELSKKDIKERINNALESINLVDSMHLRPAQLSIGEKKMISFFRAIITNPQILFLDEPTLSIDQEMKKKIFTIIKTFKDNNCTIIAVTHDPNITAMIADYLILLKGGKVIKTGTVNEMKLSKNSEVKSILSEVLDNISTYDKDILDLLSQE